MNQNYLAVISFASLLIGSSVFGVAEEKPDVLYTSPSGGWQIERSGENAWIISNKD